MAGDHRSSCSHLFTYFARKMSVFSFQKAVILDSCFFLKLHFFHRNTVCVFIPALSQTYSYLITQSTLALSTPLSPLHVASSLSQGNSLAVGQVRHGCSRGVQENGIPSEERQHLSQGPKGTTAKELLHFKVP